MLITKTWNTGERKEKEIRVPDGTPPEVFLRNTKHLGIWTEPDGRELENLEDVRVYDRRITGLIWRDHGVFDSITITW